MSWLFLLACAWPPVSEDFPDTGVTDTESTGTDTETDERWRLDPVTPRTETLSLPWGLSEAFRSTGTDGLYLVSADGKEVRFLHHTWLQPSGTACLDGTDASGTCNGVSHDAGVVSTTASVATCFDDAAQELFLLKATGMVEVIGTARDGATWKTYNRVSDVISPAATESQNPNRCAVQDGRWALSDDRQVFTGDLSGDGWTSSTPINLPYRPTELAWVGQTDWLVSRSVSGDVHLVDGSAVDTGVLALEGPLRDDHTVTDLLVDGERHRVWMAHEGGVSWVELDGSGADEEGTLQIDGTPRSLVLFARNGAVALTWEDSAGDHHIGVVLDGALVAEEVTATRPALLLPPGARMDLGWLEPASAPSADSGDTAEPEASHALQVRELVDSTDARPPVTVFAVTTLEEPFTNASMPCTEADLDTDEDQHFAELLDQLRDNLAHVADLGVPVVIGVTWEFVDKLADCDELGLLDELDSAGLELGYMVHHKPCYSCTDQEVSGEDPDLCLPTDPDYTLATAANACWPSDAEYCPRGDQDCWLAYTGPRALEVDEALPGGAQFVFGADRHSLWDWDWVQGYQDFPRADGSTGFDLTLFAGSWSYPEMTGTDDPRGKDEFPREADLRGHTWHPRSLDEVTLDSSFSTLRYLPGNPVAISRVHDVHLSDLSMGHVIEELNTTTTEADFEASYMALRQVRDRRGDEPTTWYFHLPDLTGYPLFPDEDDHRPEVGQMTQDFADALEASWGSEGDGTVVFGTPRSFAGEVE